jgi:hypothetical protein
MEEQNSRHQSSRHTNSLRAISAIGNPPEEKPNQGNDAMGSQEE